ncbi:MAG TPA: hypothetical protein VFE14_02665 [Micromonosporaceae bacterium]|jgi:hypothetical protein|nr:hypothetical protein [Micromonosporaceae bacterium]
MRLAGRSSWEIRIDERQAWLVALYVRDAAGLRPAVEPALPPLSPEVRPIMVAGTDTAAAAVDWAGLWVRLVADNWPTWFVPPGFGLPASSALRPLLAACWRDALEWGSARRRHIAALTTDRQHGPVPNDVVRAVGKQLGRRVRDFTLRIDVVPVDQIGTWPLAPDHVIISEAAVADVRAFRALLTPLVRALA